MSSPQRSGAERDAESESGEGLLPRPIRDVLDPGGRWRAQIEAGDGIRVTDEAGYVHVVVPSGARASLNCFVYNVPLDAGQAVKRFLRSVSVGLEFTSFELSRIEVIQESPVLVFEGKHHSTQSEDASGHLSFLLSPRLDFPIVCSRDAPKKESGFDRVTKAFLESFKTQLKPATQPLVTEIWKVQTQSSLLGFRYLRVFENNDSSLTSLSLSAHYSFKAGVLSSGDSVAVEVQDSQGLLRGKWLSLTGMQKNFEVNLERVGEAAPFEFRFIGESRARPLRGQFQSEALLASFDPRGLLPGCPAPAAQKSVQSVQRYIPELNHRAPSSVELSRDSGQLLSMVAGLQSVTVLDDCSRPKSQRAVGSETESILLFRAGPPPERPSQAAASE